LELDGSPQDPGLLDRSIEEAIGQAINQLGGVSPVIVTSVVCLGRLCRHCAGSRDQVLQSASWPAARGEQVMVESRRLPGAQGRLVVITLPAAIDVSNAGQVGAELCSAFVPSVRAVVADMTTTTSCDRAGVRMLVAAHWKATTLNSELRLVVFSTAVWDALAAVKSDYLPPIYATLRDAMAPEHSPGHEPAGDPPQRRSSGPAPSANRDRCSMPAGVVIPRSHPGVRPDEAGSCRG
jgi:anti-anti-sigma regulatory factor